jgi:Flp pilus assembly protein TadG
MQYPFEVTDMWTFFGKKRFLSDDDGAATIEAVLWMPFFVLVFGLIADASLLFNTQAALTRIVQDANREYSIGLLKSEADTEAFILARVGAVQNDPSTSVKTTYANGLIRTTVTVPAKDYMAVGFFRALTGIHLTVTSEQVMES